MRFGITLAVFIGVCVVAKAQYEEPLANYLKTGVAMSVEQADNRIGEVLEKLGPKGKRTDRQYLRNAFGITHRQLLKQYDQYSSFGDLFKNGKYDCLTATALYSLIFSRLGYEHQIIETNFHIFLLVQSEEGEVLIESTDPIAGFEYQADKIEQRIEQYLSDQSTSSTEYQVGYNLFEKVSSNQLTGLLYYNQCVRAFNSQRWMEARELLANAKQYYDSPRTEEMEMLLVSVIASIELENSNSIYPDAMVSNSLIASRNP